MSIAIKEWAVEDRPREKLAYWGKEKLSNAELLAIIIGSGNATQSAVDLAMTILKAHKHNLKALSLLSKEELQKFKGIGLAKAITIIAAMELGKRANLQPTENSEVITSSKLAYNSIRNDIEDLKHEEFWVIFLNQRNAVIAKEAISSGGVSKTIVDPKIIFKKALQHLSNNIILAHNHPSGNLKASEADIHVTQKIIDGGKVLDIKVLDHLIITSNSYVSMNDEAYLVFG